MLGVWTMKEAVPPIYQTHKMRKIPLGSVAKANSGQIGINRSICAGAWGRTYRGVWVEKS